MALAVAGLAQQLGLPGSIVQGTGLEKMGVGDDTSPETLQIGSGEAWRMKWQRRKRLRRDGRQDRSIRYPWFAY
jgi:hypothetical protein